MYTLSRFGFSDLMDCRTALRTIFDDEPATLGDAGQRLVSFFRRELVDDAGQPACVLVRLFKTHPYSDLDPELQAFARNLVPGADDVRDLRCLVLLATAGDLPEWNDRRASRGHAAIPLVSESMVNEAPMIAQLIREFGLDVATVLRPAPGLLLEPGRETALNVFHVPQAAGSPHIVAQEEFVARYGIESVLGFGGMLATGDLFATILFSRVQISADTADAFKVLGLNLKLALLPLARKPLFA